MGEEKASISEIQRNISSVIKICLAVKMELILEITNPGLGECGGVITTGTCGGNKNGRQLSSPCECPANCTGSRLPSSSTAVSPSEEKSNGCTI